MKTDKAEDAPAYALTSVLRAFDATLTETKSIRSSLTDRISAVLRFDSMRLGPAYGFRSGHVAAGRQMLFSAGDYAFDVRLVPGTEDWDIVGQVFGNVGHGSISLESQGGVLSSPVGPDGDFRIESVSAGVYRCVFRSESVVAEFPDLEIG
jgi:hypothetical protein